MISVSATPLQSKPSLLISLLYSAGAELYYRHHRLPYHRTTHDLGILQ